MSHGTWGFPGGTRSKEPASNAGDVRDSDLSPGVGKIPWRRAWQPTPVFFSGESHGQRNLAGYSLEGRKESGTTEAPEHTCAHEYLTI